MNMAETNRFSYRMTPEELQAMSTLRCFPETAHELIRIAGTSAAAALIAAWPGQEFPVPLCTRDTERSQRRFDQLAEIVGEPAALRIIGHWGGQKLFVPNCAEAFRQRRDERIRTEYDRLTGRNGYTHQEAIFEIGIAHRITGRAVEHVLKRAV